MRIKFYLGALLTCSMLAVSAQPITYKAPKVASVDMSEVQQAVDVQIYHQEAPDAFSKQGALNQIKQAADAQFGRAENISSNGMAQKTMAADPVVLDDFGMTRVFTVTGLQVPLPGGTPNDNTLAINADSMLLGAVNSFIWGWDLKADTFLFQQQFINLKAATGVTEGTYSFDPRLHYDPDHDRFIMTYCIGSSPSSSYMAMCFSQTNDPRDGWHSYVLPGNPLNNNRWSDFPSLSVSEDKVMLTVNLIVPNVSWQVGFDGSIIWEMDKMAGYNGLDSLPSELHHDIRYNGKYIRNLYSVTGWDGTVSTPMFMSNRNFDAQNDSVFFLRRNDSAVGGTHSYDIFMIPSSQPYGVPPNARQPSTPINDPNKGMQTNDGRWLGGMEMPDGSLHVVSTTRDFNTQRSAIYHGALNDPWNPDTLHGHVIGDIIKWFGYPSMVWLGNENCDGEVLIGFNHTSQIHYPGVSCIYYGNDGSYSNVIEIKAGEGNVSKLGGLERWGDYFGLQTVYDEPQKAWLSGFYGLANGNNSTWFAAVKSPDSSAMQVQISSYGAGCDVSLDASVMGGVPPYTYHWNGTEGASTQGAFCSGDSIDVLVSDARGCSQTYSVYVPYAEVETPALFPNPTQGSTVLAFEMDADGEVRIDVISSSGQTVISETREVKAGRNEAVIWLGNLAHSIYTVRVVNEASADGAEFVLAERIFVTP